MLTRWMLILAVLVLAGCHGSRVDKDLRLAAYDDAPWRRVLEGTVRNGLVDYAALAEHHEDDLDLYLDAVGRFGPLETPEQFETREDELAFYLNAYNAIILRRWLDAKADTVKPNKKVDLFWFVIDHWRVDDRWLSLNTLEQSTIRRGYQDPRIHFALVCGALSCPPLLDEPYTGDRLEEQMDDIGRRWLRYETDGLHIDAEGQVYFSQIFMWYLGDFDDWGGMRGVVERYLEPEDTRAIAAIAALDAGEAQWLPYDWTINRIPGRLMDDEVATSIDAAAR